MYGAIIKEIRKAKGFTQKEVYTGIVSKTFYSDFEAEKYSVEITKFEGLLSNLGVTFEEFFHFKNAKQIDEKKSIENRIDELYKGGQFEKLYALYEEYKQDRNSEIRYLAINAYLLVLITNTNFYKFSREPFNEILHELENAKMWTLKEIKLSKLVLLSLSEKDKIRAEELYKRILDELEKYKQFDGKTYYEELGDVCFNYTQSLLITNDIQAAQVVLQRHTKEINQSDSFYLMIQLQFITCVVNLYTDFPTNQFIMQELLKQLNKVPTSEINFYNVIFQIHQEKARNYYERYVESKSRSCRSLS